VDEFGNRPAPVDLELGVLRASDVDAVASLDDAGGDEPSPAVTDQDEQVIGTEGSIVLATPLQLRLPPFVAS